MSQGSSPAGICSDATGVGYKKCLEWQRSDLISRHQPIPDAKSADQRSFEARIAHEIATLLCDMQLDGAVMGVDVAIPSPHGLELQLHPLMAKRVLAVLQGKEAPESGRLGVPGLRPKWIGKTLVLRDSFSDACVHVTGLPRQARFWTEHQGKVSKDETRMRSDWASAVRGERVDSREWILSRLLRRPKLLRAIGGHYGQVNSYSHGWEDLILEWCCGPEPKDIVRQFDRSGLSFYPIEPLYEFSRWFPDGTPDEIRLADSQLIFRRYHRKKCPADPARSSRVRELLIEDYR